MAHRLDIAKKVKQVHTVYSMAKLLEYKVEETRGPAYLPLTEGTCMSVDVWLCVIA